MQAEIDHYDEKSVAGGILYSVAFYCSYVFVYC